MLLMRVRRILLLALLLILAPDDYLTAEPVSAPAAGRSHSQPASGVTEMLGKQIDGEAVFLSEAGNPVVFQSLLDKPTLLLPVYYTCPDVCSILQGNVSRILPQVELEPAKDFQVISVSFDEKDAPKLARQKKMDFLTAVGNDFPDDGWMFLTGTRDNITALMDSIGFSFSRQGEGFRHPVTAVALAPGGKIVRYLYGYDFLPFDVTMAMTEAGEGKTGLSIKRVFAYCFSYDPVGKKYVLDIMKISGVVILALLLMLVIALYFGGRKKESQS